MPTVDDFFHRIKTVGIVPASGILPRIVPEFCLHSGATPDFLYTSGKPNRFNPQDVLCVYFSEDEPTALEEYLRPLRGTPAEFQPRTTYFARVSLANVLDLKDDAT